MTLPVFCFLCCFPQDILKTRLPPNCATGFFDRLKFLISCEIRNFLVETTGLEPVTYGNAV